jgi:hypothetical protein
LFVIFDFFFTMKKFKAVIEIIGVNPFVTLPDPVLAHLFRQAGKDKGPIPVKGTINGQPYTQTLVKFKGLWRLYINLKMLDHSTQRIGEVINITIAFDPEKRVIDPPLKFVEALQLEPKAKRVFDSLRPSLQLEIVRYIAGLKTEDSVDRNVEKAIQFLLGNGRFVGRAKI